MVRNSFPFSDPCCLPSGFCAPHCSHLLLGAAAALAQATPSASEQKLIDTLILRVSNMKTMTFMRNGDEHNAANAAKHMQAKFDHFKDEIVTAEDFIDGRASRSEMTGKPYQVKMPNGAVRDRRRIPDR